MFNLNFIKMKKSILILGTVIFLFAGGSVLTSCGNQENAQKSEKTTQVEEYQCPMKCEGEKTYDKPGKCPVCGMRLKKVKI